MLEEAESYLLSQPMQLFTSPAGLSHLSLDCRLSPGQENRSLALWKLRKKHQLTLYSLL